MKTYKIFILLIAIVFAFSLIRVPVPVFAQQSSPRISVIYNQGVVLLYGWPIGSEVTLTIDSSDDGHIDYTDHMLFFIEDTGFNVDKAFDIQVGDKVEVTNRDVTKTLKVANLILEGMSNSNNRVWGMADDGAVIQVLLLQQSIFRNIIVDDPNRHWVADFSVAMPGEEPAQMGLGNSMVAIQEDDDGDQTQHGWLNPYVSTPHIHAGPDQGFVYARGWPTDTATVQMDITRSGSIIYTSSTIMGPCIGNPASPSCGPNDAYFDLGNNDSGFPRFDLQPGDKITLTGGEITRSMIVSKLQVTEANASTDTISGMADIGSYVAIGACGGPEMLVTPDSSSHWEANLAPYDLLPDPCGAVEQFDEAGNITQQGWSNPNPPPPPQCQSGNTVSGAVYEHDGITPIPSATIQIEDYSTSDILFTTNVNQNGQFACSLPEGNYRVLALADNYTQEYYNETTDTNATRIPVTTGTTIQNINFTLERIVIAEALTFNFSNPLIADATIRRAIALGTDRQRIMNEAFLPAEIYGQLLDTPVNPGHFYQAPASELTLYAYDPNEARALLTIAGWEDTDTDGIREKNGQELRFNFKTTLNPMRVISAQIFRENMGAIGIEVTVTNDPNFFADGGALELGEFDIAEFANVLFPADVLLYRSDNEINYGHYDNPEYDGAVEAFQSAQTEAARVIAALEIQQIITADLPAFYLFTRENIVPFQTPIGTNVTLTPMPAVTINYTNVNSEGITTALAVNFNPADLPHGYQLLDSVYEIGTSAMFEHAQVCFAYNDDGLTLSQETAVRLYHMENNTWVDVTNSGYPDTGNNIVCGTVSSFSPFAIMYPNDTTPPTITWTSDIKNGDSFYFGSVPLAPTCTAVDSQSGMDGSCEIIGYAATIGTHTLIASAKDLADNTASEYRTYTILPWTLKGFYQPVDMNGVYNVVKGGSTVPFKFEVFAGSTELTNVADIKSLIYAQTSCDANAKTDEIETTVMGDTNLRYTDGQFIYNWKTPKTTGCYRVTLTAIDGSSLMAYFKFK